MMIRAYRSADETAVVKLWQQCGLIQPQDNPLQDIARKLSVQPELFLVGYETELLVATVMAGYEGHRGWLNYLAVKPGYRNTGAGKKIISEAEKKLHRLGCPKINVQVRLSNSGIVKFYRKIGFHQDQVISMGKHLVQDE